MDLLGMERMLELLGFPVWAVVLLLAVVKITSMFRSLIDQLAQYHTEAATRLTLLEEIVKRHDKQLDRHEVFYLTGKIEE